MKNLFLSASCCALLMILGSITPIAAQCTDADSDGYFQESGCGTEPDCDDANSSIYPHAPDFCDGVNNDCDDPMWPEVLPSEMDADSDGSMVCSGDCDESDPDIYPGAEQICDGKNNDCDDPDWPDLPDPEIDDDSDGLSDCDGDCNDGDPATHPGATETCDGYDNDCSGFMDDDPACDGACERPGMAGAPLILSTDLRGAGRLTWNGAEFAVVWSDDKSGGGDQSEVYFARIDAAGSQIGTEVRLTNAPFDQSGPRIAWTGSHYGIAWADERDEYPWSFEEYFLVTDHSGAQIQAERKVAPRNLTGSLMWTGAEYAFVYTSGWSYLTRLDQEGVKVADDVQIDQSWPFGWGQYETEWAGLQFGLTWQVDHDTYGELYFARLSPEGAELGDHQLLPDPAGTYPSSSNLCWNGSHFGVVWHDYVGPPSQEIYFALLDSDGNKVSGDTRISFSDYASYNPRIIWTGTEFNILWVDYVGADRIAYLARVDAAGAKVGDSVQLELPAPTLYSYYLAWTGSQHGIVYMSELQPDTLLFSRIGCDCLDNDSDGWTDCRPDCDDSDPDMYPGNPEICDELDNDCNGLIDDDELGEDPDTDGLGNVCDDCPFDHDNDIDSDLICGDVDNCPIVANNDQSDQDSDGLGDVCDDCPLDPSNDADSDFICGAVDNCPATPNTDQSDQDSDDLGDVCDDCPLDPSNDIDSDSVCGAGDNCPATPNADQDDLDSDHAGDACDNCPADENVDQADFDGDGSGDVCDNCTDTDNDGYGNPGFPENLCPVDNCPRGSNPTQADSDSDGKGDACDPCPLAPDADTDGDLVCEDIDNCIGVFNPGQEDSDSDGEGDLCDADDGLIYTYFHFKEWFEWQEEGGFDSWNAYKGDLSVLKSSGVYTQLPGSNYLADRDCGRTDGSLEDAAPPVSGDCAFFLTAGVTGMTEGSLGNDSEDVPRSNDNPCP